jgi:hypothetical protein
MTSITPPLHFVIPRRATLAVNGDAESWDALLVIELPRLLND